MKCNICSSRRLILASGSPRRQELLARMGYSFESCSPEVDEQASGCADQVVSILAERKARAVVPKYQDAVIIASDTLVSLDGKPLGKPSDREDAKKMLTALSGRSHEVFSGVCIIDALSGKMQKQVVCTGVTFRKLDPDEIDKYIETGEPMDKAGAYAIQGGARDFVERLEGSFENVMGFPVKEVKEMLKAMGL